MVLRRTNRTRRHRDRGQASVEFIGMLPILIVIGLALVQFGIAAYAIQQVGTGARAAARTASHDDPEISPEAAGRAAMSDWIAKSAQFTLSTGVYYDEVEVTATVTIPSIIPGIGLGDTEKTVTMPRD